MHESWQLQPFQLPPRSVLPAGLQCLWETSSPPVGCWREVVLKIMLGVGETSTNDWGQRVPIAGVDSL